MKRFHTKEVILADSPALPVILLIKAIAVAVLNLTTHCAHLPISGRTAQIGPHKGLAHYIAAFNRAIFSRLAQSLSFLRSMSLPGS
jgi:hypothetical protein